MPKEQEKKILNEPANEVETRDFHVWLKSKTAAWLRKRINTDAPTVPAVIRDILEEAQRADEKRPEAQMESG